MKLEFSGKYLVWSLLANPQAEQSSKSFLYLEILELLLPLHIFFSALEFNHSELLAYDPLHGY